MKDLNDIVRRLKSGEQEAFTELYAETEKITMSVIRRYCDIQEDYDDLMQETYIQVYKHIGELQDESKAQAWINKIAANTAIRHNMKKRPAMFSEMADEEGNIPEFRDENENVDPEKVAEKDVITKIVKDVLSLLPEDQRDALWMVYGQKITIREMASSLGISENTIKSRLYQGRQKLLARRADFERMGISLSVIPVSMLVYIAFNEDVYAANGIMNWWREGASAARTAADGAGQAGAGNAAAGQTGANQAGAPAAGSFSANASGGAMPHPAAGAAGIAGMSLGVKAAIAAGAIAVAAAGGIGAHAVLTHHEDRTPAATTAYAEEERTEIAATTGAAPETRAELPPETTAAEKQSVSEAEIEEAKTAYAQHLQEIILNDPYNAYDSEEPVKYKYDDIDGDGIPELIYSQRPWNGRGYQVAIDTYQNGEVRSLYEDPYAEDYEEGYVNEYGFGGGGTVTYYPGSGLIYGENGYGSSGGQIIALWRMEDGIANLICYIDYNFYKADEAGAFDSENDYALIPEKVPAEAVNHVDIEGNEGSFQDAVRYIDEQTAGYEKVTFDYFDETNLDFNELMNSGTGAAAGSGNEAANAADIFGRYDYRYEEGPDGPVESAGVTEQYAIVEKLDDTRIQISYYDGSTGELRGTDIARRPGDNTRYYEIPVEQGLPTQVDFREDGTLSIGFEYYSIYEKTAGLENTSAQAGTVSAGSISIDLTEEEKAALKEFLSYGTENYKDTGYLIRENRAILKGLYDRWPAADSEKINWDNMLVFDGEQYRTKYTGYGTAFIIVHYEEWFEDNDSMETYIYTYTGDFVNGIPEGKGTSFNYILQQYPENNAEGYEAFEDETIEYGTGSFKQARLNGQGETGWYDLKDEALQTPGLCLSGTFADDLMEGKVEYYWKITTSEEKHLTLSAVHGVVTDPGLYEENAGKENGRVRLKDVRMMNAVFEDRGGRSYPIFNNRAVLKRWDRSIALPEIEKLDKALGLE